MTNLLNISGAASLAMHMMAFIADDSGELHTTDEIARALDVSAHHLAKVRARLSKAGLVKAQSGPGGGLRLGRPASKITLLNIFETIEGPLNNTKCLFDHRSCDRLNCILGGLVESVNSNVKKYLSKTTLAKLVKNS